MKITVLDYGAGNVRSLINAVEKMGGTIKMVETPQDILDAEKLIFPGVGNYASMIKILHERQFVEPPSGIPAGGSSLLRHLCRHAGPVRGQ